MKDPKRAVYWVRVCHLVNRELDEVRGAERLGKQDVAYIAAMGAVTYCAEQQLRADREGYYDTATYLRQAIADAIPNEVKRDVLIWWRGLSDAAKWEVFLASEDADLSYAGFESNSECVLNAWAILHWLNTEWDINRSAPVRWWEDRLPGDIPPGVFPHRDIYFDPKIVRSDEEALRRQIQRGASW